MKNTTTDKCFPIQKSQYFFFVCAIAITNYSSVIIVFTIDFSHELWSYGANNLSQNGVQNDDFFS